MKVAIVYNRQKKNVINLFGQLNQEKIGKKTIQRILNALKKGKHQAIALEGDKELVPRLEEFMPRLRSSLMRPVPGFTPTRTKPAVRAVRSGCSARLSWTRKRPGKHRNCRG